jgi:hypothetical protein
MLRVWHQEYDTLSVCWYFQHAPQHTLIVPYSQRRTLRHMLIVSAPTESIILSASYSQHALRESLTLRVWYSQCESISIILSACSAETLIARWEYDTLSACWEYDDTLSAFWYSQHVPQCVLRVSYSQRHMLRHTMRVSACNESIILSASDSQGALRVSLTLRVWYSYAESIILSTANSCSYKKKDCQLLVVLLNNFGQQHLYGAANWSAAKGGWVCYTSNIMLVGRQCCCALLRLYFNSSVAVWSVGQSVSWSTIRVAGL